MNVSFEDYNTSDVATMLGVQKCTVADWCRKGYIRFQDVSSAGSNRPRYMFTVDEVNRVGQLMEKHGKFAWFKYRNEDVNSSPANDKKVEIVQPVDDETEVLTGYILKIKALKKQRDEKLEELDSIENAIKNMRQRILEAI